MPSLVLKPSRRRAAFSLIEIILALGIIAFALVGILGLFPVAVEAAANSQRETQAALIARSLFEQLEATPETKTRVIYRSEKLDAEGANANTVTIDLSDAGTHDEFFFDVDGKPLASKDASTAFETTITVAPITTPDYGLSQVKITVKPLAAPASRYDFVSILRQQ